jgi:hypothetical protein
MGVCVPQKGSGALALAVSALPMAAIRNGTQSLPSEHGLGPCTGPVCPPEAECRQEQ